MWTVVLVCSLLDLQTVVAKQPCEATQFKQPVSEAITKCQEIELKCQEVSDE